ncbi:hypothetical protein DBP19_32845 [Streptomyces sp. CS090A]|uniref:hypothetical protein n=1 Tax=Streptomyces sp. CS090A TaxID=2162710 RepID=UPI000D521210|nr:hypothetical protein [Streptomyces sp. CS090A]PVC83899.1 hypothetical protein DBP19_32845 [Streptomyces sp. CS090A]
MSNGAKVAVAGVVAGVALWALLGFWWALLVVIGVPVAGYLLLDPSQRSRLRRVNRKQIGR